MQVFSIRSSCCICPAYISKTDLNYEKQIILLMIPNKKNEGCHYLVLKKLSTSLRRKSSKHHSAFFGLNCLHSIRTENKLKSQEKVCKNKDFGRIALPSEK